MNDARVSEVVTVATSSEVLERWPSALQALTQPERDRAGSMASSDDFIASHLLARECVSRLCGQAPADIVIVQRCDDCSGAHGRPSVAEPPGLCVSWSHSHGLIGAAAANHPIGIDVESRARIGELTDGVIARTMTDAETGVIAASRDRVGDFLRAWTAKEALLKVGAIERSEFATTRILVDDPPLATTAISTWSATVVNARGAFRVDQLHDIDAVVAIATPADTGA